MILKKLRCVVTPRFYLLAGIRRLGKCMKNKDTIIWPISMTCFIHTVKDVVFCFVSINNLFYNNCLNSCALIKDST